ncbi:MAG TPA: RDD family protein [Acidimicrobiales bacterium]|nr:RDD family protein [Acidimicrobiales bacterium]
MSELPPIPPGVGGTPQLAEIGPRVVAFLIDWVGAYVAMFLVFAVVGALLSAISDALGALFGLLGFVAYLGFWFWQVYQEGTTGQTIGKRMQNVKLVGLENGGQPVGFGMAFARNFVNGICGLFWLFPFFDAQRQTLGDKVSKTVVVPA